MNAAHFPVFLLAALCLPGCGKKAPAGPPQMPPAAVTVAPVVSEPVNVSIDLPGRIQAIRTAEVRARRIVERMALSLQGALLVRYGHPEVAKAFVASRLGGDWGHALGTLPRGLDFAAIAARHAVGA